MLQEGRGCIGDRAISVLAQIVIIWWSRQLKTRLNKLEIMSELLKIYRDDVNGIYHSIRKGIRHIDGNLVYSTESEI